MKKTLEASSSRPAKGKAADLDWLAPLAAEMAGLGYWHYAAPEDRLTLSDEVYKIYGLDPKTVTPNLSLLDSACHPDDRERLARHRKERSGKEAEIEVRIVRPDGEVRHVIAKSRVETGPRGQILVRYGTLSDITEMKRAEAAARESEERYRFLAEHAPDMISRVTPEGEIKYLSPSCERVFGYTPEEHIKLTPMEMCHPDDIGGVGSAIVGMTEKRQTRLDEPLRYRARHKDGRWIWVEANPILILDQNGEPLEFVDIVRDITDTVLTQAELREARADAEAAATAKSTFLANMSHELRTPLTSIIGFSRLLREREDLSGEAGHYAKRIADASEALLTIINDVLDFSKLEAGQVALEARPLSVARLADEAMGLVSLQAAAKGVALRMDLDPQTPALIEGDMARLRQVLLNLLSNAVKFTDSGAVTIRTRWRDAGDGGRLRVSVVDTGQGIAPEKVSRLFERFSQADVSINRTHGGTGLGLAICKGIVGLMEGKIGVRSRPGRGSTFWFEIPAKPAAAAEAETVEESVLETGPLRMLVVDDTPVNRELVRLMLSPLGLHIEEAGGGAEGIQAASAKTFDLILMDVRMPGVDGLEATRAIRASDGPNARTPILALTADVQPENTAACRDAGMDDVLAKPIVPRELLSKITRWSAGAAAEGEPPLARTAKAVA